MKTKISTEEALDIIRSAFAPLRCIAEDVDYHYFRFRVFNEEDDGILKAPKLSAGDIGTREALERVILQGRSNIEGQGIILEPWEMPPRPGSAT